MRRPGHITNRYAAAVDGNAHRCDSHHYVNADSDAAAARDDGDTNGDDGFHCNTKAAN
jgi:hypothetical protein